MEVWWENPALWVLKTFFLWLWRVTSSLNFELEHFFKMSQLPSFPLILSGGIGGSVPFGLCGFLFWSSGRIKTSEHGAFILSLWCWCRVGWSEVWMRCRAEGNGSNGVLWWKSSRPGTQVTWFCSFDVNLRPKWPQHLRLDSSWQSKQGTCLSLFWCPPSVIVLRGGCFQSTNAGSVPLLRTNSGKLALFSETPPSLFSLQLVLCVYLFFSTSS